jgi:4-amino-4-deoxy-L-arabinose transferase-like glycosyltransferase
MSKRSRERRRHRDHGQTPVVTAPPAERPPVARAAARPAAPIVPSWSPFWSGHWRAALVLLSLALAVRVGVLVEISRSPFFHVRNIDSEAYHQWALRIAAGHWLPTESFYQSPFYAYVLAALYTLFGTGTWSARVVQVLVGSLAVALVYAIGTRLASPRVGWMAGIGLALYGPLVLEEVTISKTTLLVATSLAGFALYLWEAPRAHARGLVAAGALFGITVVGVGQWLLPFLALVAWAPMMVESPAPALRRRAAAAFAVGGLAIILPVVIWNSARGGGPMLTSGDAGLNFFNGNNARASGLPAKPAEVRDVPQHEEADARALAERAVGRRLSPAEVSRYWAAEGLGWIVRHPLDWVVTLGRKLITLWNAFEIPDNYHYAFMRAHFLRSLWPLATFALVAPLALVGGAMPFWRRRDLTALYLACGLYLATVLLFYIRGRYRLPAVPFLVVLAAIAVERLLRAVATRRWPAALALAGGLVVATVVVNHERCEPAHDGLPAVCLGGDAWFDSEWLKLSQWSLDRGDPAQAVRYAERGYESTRPRRPGMVPAWIAGVEARWTQDLVSRGRRDEALAHFGRAENNYRSAIGLGYERGPLLSELGTLYTIVDRPAEAVAAFEAAYAADFLDAGAAPTFARAYVKLGRCADAERIMSRVDRALGFREPSGETRAVLGACGPPR